MGCPNEGPHVTPYKMRKWGPKMANLEQNDIFLNNKTKGNTLIARKALSWHCAVNKLTDHHVNDKRCSQRNRRTKKGGPKPKTWF